MKILITLLKSVLKKFSNIPYEELFDLQLDPYEKNNLARNKKYNRYKKYTIKELDNWMIDQKTL